jgi:hypothetical protein
MKVKIVLIDGMYIIQNEIFIKLWFQLGFVGRVLVGCFQIVGVFLFFLLCLLLGERFLYLF